MLTRVFIAIVILCCFFKGAAQCGGMDIIIANDQSGSVDGQENMYSREFISAFAQGFPLGNGQGQYRIAIADWDFNNGWQQYNFPIAGQNFTTQLSDVISYAAAPRLLNTGTDVPMALQKSYAILQQQSSNRPKVIMIMTDAAGSGTQGGLVELAAQVKAAGIYIVMVAVN